MAKGMIKGVVGLTGGLERNNYWVCKVNIC